jgi:predicted RNA-binding Zn-ribbon protein involved in translation (DUF1610 family)
MAIKHTPRPLKGKRRLFVIWGLAVGLACFGLMFGAMLTGRWIGTPSAVILTIVIFVSAIVIHSRIKHRLALSLESTTPCPQCGQCRMNFREERNLHAYLICPYCGIKWDLGQI